MTGPNNTTNFMTSSLQTPVQYRMNCLVIQGLACEHNESSSDTGSLGYAARHFPFSHLSNGESKSGGSYGTTWGAYGSNYSGDKCSSPNGQANGDTVNATLMQPAGLWALTFKLTQIRRRVWESEQ